IWRCAPGGLVVAGGSRPGGCRAGQLEALAGEPPAQTRWKEESLVFPRIHIHACGSPGGGPVEPAPSPRRGGEGHEQLDPSLALRVLMGYPLLALRAPESLSL